MGRGKAHNWTDKEIATVIRMRNDNASYSAISNKLGNASKETVRRKVRELVQNGDLLHTDRVRPVKENSWSKKDVATLTRGYEAGDDMKDIVARLERDCNSNNAYSKAASLKLRRGPRKNDDHVAPSISPPDETADEMADEVLLRTLMLSGLTPNEAAAFTPMTKKDIQKAFDRMGWKKETGPKERGILRGRLQNRALSILGRPLDRDDPEHLMVILTLCADSTQRNLSEIAKLSLLPLPWIERVFGRLDLEGVWPVTDDSSDDLCPSDYERFAEICRQEIHSLKRIVGERLRA